MSIPDYTKGSPIPWLDGTGQYFYIDLTPLFSGETYRGKITSDVNTTDFTRTRTFTIGTGVIDTPHNTIAITVEQDKFSIVTVTYELTASVYDETKAGYPK